MMTHTQCLMLTSTYRDSVVLMQLSHTLEGLPDVRQAAVMMGTPQNKTLLRQADLLTAEGEQASANDLLICVQADSPAAAERAVYEARQQLSHHQMTIDDAGERAPRTLATALRRLPNANLACISVPGQYARHEARKAIENGLHVFLFSDHVDLEAEAELKQLAAQQGVLVMGPDCGTAMLNGVPLGFANHVTPGPVGLISASGTGLQHVMCLLARQGIGISQAIGVGGRDLHSRIGGNSMRRALRALGNDRDTRVVVLLSKPPEAAVASCLRQEAAQIGKPCVVAFLGDASGRTDTAPVYTVTTLEDAALAAGALVRGEPVPADSQALAAPLVSDLETLRTRRHPRQQTIKALYCGGTLAYETLWLLRRDLGTVRSNLDGTLDTADGIGHEVLDLGAEAFTRGRPHPMIDPSIRQQRLLDIAGQPEVAVVLCDVILGWGSHADPAGALAMAWQETRQRAQAEGRHLVGIAVVCGTPGDPQGYDRQCEVLRTCGLIPVDSNAQAVRLAVMMVRDRVLAERPTAPREVAVPHAIHENALPEVPAHLPALFAAGPRVINLGLERFAIQMAACGAPVVHVDWRPPAGGDERLANLLERLRS